MHVCENVIGIEIGFLNNNPSLYFNYHSQECKTVLPYLYKVELFYLWPYQAGLSTDYKNYSQRNLVLAITQKLLDHSVHLEDYETYCDFLENSEMKENADWDVSNTYFESENCIVSLNGTSNHCPWRYWVAFTYITIELYSFKK